MRTNQLIEKLHDWQRAFIRENCGKFRCIPLCEGKQEECIVLQAADRIRLLDNALSNNYAIQYLNTALDYVLKREKIEKEMIDKMNRKVCEDPEWPVKLSEWKLANDVRIMSPYQVKRFVKAISNK